jgi:uncharacterized protein YndB with AHSA1/START domain
MTLKENSTLTVQTTIRGSLEKVWDFWTTAEHITRWNNASDDWHTTRAVNDLQPGGKFLFRMEAKDGSFGFDFEGVYDEVITNQLLSYTLGDGRKVKLIFTALNNETKVIENFEAESENSLELQLKGWQNILDNFKLYTESN